MSEKVYSRVTEAEEMIKELCKKYPDLLWAVRPDMVAVYGIENKDRSESCDTLAKIKPLKGVEKTILQDNHIPIRYYIDLYWNDWRNWTESKKQWILVHELMHIHPEVGKTIKHDIEDFRVLIDKVGVKGYDDENLPNLLLTDVKFNLDLRPKVEEAEEKDEIDEDNKEKKKRGRPKKNEEVETTKESKSVEDEKDGDIF